MRTLTIGVITPGFATADDPGMPAVVDQVATVTQQHYVRVLALRYPPQYGGYILGGSKIRSLGGGTTSGAAGRTRLMARAVRRIVNMHGERPFDVLHALWADEPGAIAVACGRILDIRVVVSVMGGELAALPDIAYGTALGRGGRWSVATAFRGAQVVTVGSSTLMDQVADRVPADRLRLLPLGVDLTDFSPGEPAEPTQGRLVLHVGSLEPVKDQVTLLRAFARAAADRDDVRLRIIGDGSLQSSLERLADHLGVADRVEFLGQLPREALVDHYRAASLVAVASRWEAQSMVAVEAAACGRPVVGTAVGCLPDLGDAARTVPVADHAALGVALGEILDDAEARDRMGAAARRVAETTYDLQQTSAALVSAAYRS